MALRQRKKVFFLKLRMCCFRTFYNELLFADDPEITKTYSLYSCWPSVEDKIWKCWDKSSKIEEIKDDDNNEFLLDYDRRSSSSKSYVKSFPKATVPSYPKENVAPYPKGNIASIEITAKPYRSNYSSYYDPTSYSIR